jgi:hypothetical protein
MESYYNKFNLIYKLEYNYWKNNIIKKWIKIDSLCPNCKNNSFKEKKYTYSITNPIKLKCTKKM